MDKLAERIKDKYGTQKAFAEACGTTESNISRMLNGSRTWKAEMMWKAAEVLDIPDDEIRSYFFDRKVALKATEER